MVNKIELIGHVGNFVDIKSTSDGREALNFSIATKDKAGPEAKVQWHRIIVWDPSDYFKTIKSGDLVYVTGKYVSKKIQHVNGGEVQDFKVIADHQLILKPKL